MFPFKENLCRFDFEVDEADEYMCDFTKLASKLTGGLSTPEEQSL